MRYKKGKTQIAFEERAISRTRMYKYLKQVRIHFEWNDCPLSISEHHAKPFNPPFTFMALDGHPYLELLTFILLSHLSGCG